MHSRLLRFGRVLFVGLGLFYLPGCNIEYYTHLALGQGRILYNRRPIEDLLASPLLNEDDRKKFALIGSILNFAATLGLETGDSYTSFYDTKGQPISWNVSASPPDRFAPFLWDFPIAGTVPYKGYFYKEKADTERDRLIAAGYDANVRPVGAYSTLGYFSDPILSGMLEYSPGQLADLIIHELTHATAYSSGHADFNESLATFIGRQGSLLFLKHHFGPDTPYLQEAIEQREDIQLFREFMSQTVSSLDSLYNLDLPLEEVLRQRISIFDRRKSDYTTIRNRFTRFNYDGFLNWEPNNARLLSYRRYNSKQELFLAIHNIHQQDFTRSLSVFSICAEQDDPWACLTAATASPKAY